MYGALQRILECRSEEKTERYWCLMEVRRGNQESTTERQRGHRKWGLKGVARQEDWVGGEKEDL